MSLAALCFFTLTLSCQGFEKKTCQVRESHCVLSLHIPLLMCIDVVVVIRELGFELILCLDVVSRFYVWMSYFLIII